MKDFSLQLFSVRDIPDLREQLKAAAEAGYTGVEFCGYFGIPAAEMKTILSSLGLRPAGSHIGWDLLAKDLDGCVAYAAELGLSSAACPCMDIQTAGRRRQGRRLPGQMRPEVSGGRHSLRLSQPRP